MDECESGAHRCQSVRQCVNTAGSYRCIGDCPKGYRLSDKGICLGTQTVTSSPPILYGQAAFHFLDINECTLGLAKCRPVEECVNTDGGYTCKDTCQPGYKRKDDGSCVDIDECREQLPCHPDQQCINMIGSYKCFCPPGFVSLGIQAPCQGMLQICISLRKHVSVP